MSAFLDKHLARGNIFTQALIALAATKTPVAAEHYAAARWGGEVPRAREGHGL